ncbi:MAG: hypothetical protein ACYCS1_04310 [Gammaproteobacteria bacterium]
MVEDKDTLEVQTGKQISRTINFDDYTQNQGLRSYLVLYNKEAVIQAEREHFDEVVERAKFLQTAKQRLLAKEDYQKIGQRDFIKKSGVKKLQNAFNISVEIVGEPVIIERNWENTMPSPTPHHPTKETVVIVRARAVRKFLVNDKNTGRSVEIIGDSVEEYGSCSDRELLENKKQGYKFHNIIATAMTRASNRAIMNLLGGEVTFEEIEIEE